MIKSRSPYYIDTPFVSPLTALTCTEYLLKVYVWSGLKSAVPGTATFEFTKENPTGSTDSDSVNIARVIKDFLTFTPQEGTGVQLIDGANQMWIRTEAYYTTTDAGELGTAQNIFEDLMVIGLTYGREGRNQSVQTNKVLLDGTEFNVNRGGVFILPIQIDET